MLFRKSATIITKEYILSITLLHLESQLANFEALTLASLFAFFISILTIFTQFITFHKFTIFISQILIFFTNTVFSTQISTEKNVTN